MIDPHIHEIASFINRDHIVSVTIHRQEIVINTDDGRTLTFAVSDQAITRFTDDLANSLQSNFVSIEYRPQSE